jgi:hypothetical protein
MSDRREHVVHFQFGFSNFERQSETTERFFSQARNKEVMAAVAKKETPESLKLGTVLRQSHVRLGTKCLAAPPGQSSESRMQYTAKPQSKSANFNHLGAELRKANIDHSYGQSKTCSHWTAVDREEMSRNAVEKFACETPQGFQHLAKELRKSSLPIKDLREQPKATTESRLAYVEKPYSAQQSYADTLGKDLRASHIDIAQGHEKSTRNWVPVCHSALNANQEEKWACEKPSAFDQLGVELRKSSVPLSGAGDDFMMRKPTLGLRKVY